MTFLSLVVYSFILQNYRRWGKLAFVLVRAARAARATCLFVCIRAARAATGRGRIVSVSTETPTRNPCKL